MNKFLSTIQEIYLSARVSYLIWKIRRATANLREANAINTRMVDNAAAVLKQMQYDPEKRTVSNGTVQS